MKFVFVSLLLLTLINGFNILKTNVRRFQRLKESAQDVEVELIGHLNLDKQIFCNVELNCEYLEAIGFDMDFTLAQVRFTEICMSAHFQKNKK
jgi:hypothetical protein